MHSNYRQRRPLFLLSEAAATQPVISKILGLPLRAWSKQLTAGAGQQTSERGYVPLFHTSLWLQTLLEKSRVAGANGARLHRKQNTQKSKALFVFFRPLCFRYIFLQVSRPRRLNATAVRIRSQTRFTHEELWRRRPCSVDSIRAVYPETEHPREWLR